MNMWHTDVGRYAAGNIALMKTVFEQHLLLFGKNKYVFFFIYNIFTIILIVLFIYFVDIRKPNCYL